MAHDLTIKYGRGYGKSNLVYMRKLYRAFPKGMTLSYQLSWSHYLEILKCSDELEIGFYVAECVRSNWNVRELRRQMKASLFERLALSKDKKGFRIFVSRYQLYLPDKEQLRRELAYAIEAEEGRIRMSTSNLKGSGK